MTGVAATLAFAGSGAVTTEARPPDLQAAKPFVKWLGGKRRLLDHILPHLLTGNGRLRGERYLEPFVGGGAVFFEVARRLEAGQRAILGDLLEPLINAYVRIRDDVDQVIWRLEALRAERVQHPSATDHYYLTRARWNAGDQDRAEGAALFLYLNRTGFNGLWRANKAGDHNVPVGRYPDLDFFRAPAFSAASLRRVSHALQGQQIVAEDFAESLARATRGDVVYVDPPYAPVKAGSFASYTARGFGMGDQRRLATEAIAAVGRGAVVVISAPDTTEIRGLYRRSDGWYAHALRAQRAIAARGVARKPQAELVIVGGPR